MTLFTIPPAFSRKRDLISLNSGLGRLIGLGRLRLLTFAGMTSIFAIMLGPNPAMAQMIQPIPGVTANDPVDTLSMHLRTLAANPRNLSALLGAGQAAIDVGDPNAALGFFARADEIDPRSGRAKAGLATALVLLEKPDDALRLFGEALSLGIADSELARDRGLAYDLRGDNRRAQKDYAIALRRGPDDEVVRRYALSLGISGDRSQALTMLDPLLRKQDQGAWRARAFILAMNNNVSGANAIARQVMPVGLAGTMAPFLTRLARLNPAERAHAVNFGTMPSDGQTFASVELGDPFKPVGASIGGGSASAGLIPAGPPLGRQPVPPPAARKPVTVAVATPAPSVPLAPKVAPGFTTPAPPDTAGRLGTRIGTRIAAVDPTKLPPEARGEVTGATRVTAMTSLPPPDNVRPSAASMAVPKLTPLPAPVIMTPVPSSVGASPAAVTPVPGPAPTPAILKPLPVPTSTAPPVFEVAAAPKPIPTPPVQVGIVAPQQQPASVPVTLEPAPVVERPGPGLTTVSPLPPPPKMEPDAGVALPSPGFVGPPADQQAVAPAQFEVAASKPDPTPEPAKASEPAAPVSRLASILSGIEPEKESAPVALPSAAEIKAVQRAAARKTAAAAEAAAAAQLAKEEKAKEAAAAKANPARLWVQIATGSNQRGLVATWRKIREANAALLKPYGGYTVTYKATNRVLAGPLKSSSDARALVNALGKAGVSATTYSSEAGQEVVKLASK